MSTQSITSRLIAGDDRFAFLRTALRLDAVVSGANGAAYLVLAGPIGELLELSPTLLRGVGAFLAIFAAAVWWTSTRPVPPRAAVLTIAVGNIGWAAASLVAAAAGWGTPSGAGTAWIVAQGVVVAAFAELQLVGRRRAAGR